jgi:hypothetical protein
MLLFTVPYRASARESRRRKQEQMDVLAQTIAELKAENLQLKAQISGADQVKKDDIEKYELTKAMEEMIEKQTPDKDISNLLEHFEFRHADYGEQRTTKVEYHLKQVQALLTPTETTKMVMWTLNQEQDFFNEEGEPGSVSALTGGGSLWAMMCHALNMTEEQKAQLISTRARFDEIWKLLQRSFSLVSELRDTMLAKNEALINEIRVIKSILTPAQVAKFVFWVANNAACIHMLNRVLAEQKPHHVLKDLV